MAENTAQLLALLKSIRLFQKLDEPQLTRVAQAAELIRLEEEQSPELDPEQDYPFFVVASGQVSLIPAQGEEDEEYLLKKGDFFGADVLFMGGREDYTIYAVTPAQLIAISAEQMRILVQSIPRLQDNLKAQLRIYRLIRSNHFDWLNEEETVLLVRRKHPAYLLVTMLGPLGLAWLAFLVYLFAVSVETASFRLVVEWFAFAGLALAALWALWRLIDFYNDYYVVTDERVVWLERVIGLYDSRQETPMAAVKAGESQSTFLGRMLGYGDVVTEALMGKVVFRHVANPAEIKDLIDQQRRQALKHQDRSDSRAMETVIRRKLDPTAHPSETVPLVVIRHPTGEHWLADGNGNLGATLGKNNYFVSDIDADWGFQGIGSRTDILNLTEWFCSPSADQVLEELFSERTARARYTRPVRDPGGENQVVLLIPGYNNARLQGKPDDAPLPGKGLTVGAAKYVYHELLECFARHPDKLFIVMTPPPVQDSADADNARAFAVWLVNDWLLENQYAHNNVAVYDLYNVLTYPDNHHNFNPANGQVEHAINKLENTLYYLGETDLPNAEGNQKATEEFVPWLNYTYNRWKASPASRTPAPAPAAPRGLRVVNYLQTRIEEGDTITYRKHLYILFTKIWAPCLIAFILATATVYFFSQSLMGQITFPTPLTTLLFGGLLMIFPGLWWLYNFIDWRNDIYKVTADRIIDSERKPLGDEVSKSAPLENILSMDYERLGILGILLNYGNVVINVGTENKFIFYGIHDPARAQSDIFNHIIVYRRRKQLTEATQEWERVSDWLAAYDRQSTAMRAAKNSSEDG